MGFGPPPINEPSIGGAIATRVIMADLRAGGDIAGGPAPFAQADASQFLESAFDPLRTLARRWIIRQASIRRS